MHDIIIPLASSYTSCRSKVRVWTKVRGTKKERGVEHLGGVCNIVSTWEGGVEYLLFRSGAINAIKLEDFISLSCWDLGGGGSFTLNQFSQGERCRYNTGNSVRESGNGAILCRTGRVVMVQYH